VEESNYYEMALVDDYKECIVYENNRILAFDEINIMDL